MENKEPEKPIARICEPKEEGGYFQKGQLMPDGFYSESWGLDAINGSIETIKKMAPRVLSKEELEREFPEEAFWNTIYHLAKENDVIEFIRLAKDEFKARK